jgi:hypothetical protein
VEFRCGVEWETMRLYLAMVAQEQVCNHVCSVSHQSHQDYQSSTFLSKKKSESGFYLKIPPLTFIEIEEMYQEACRGSQNMSYGKFEISSSSSVADAFV